jgi:hypothetical protein
MKAGPTFSRYVVHMAVLKLVSVLGGLRALPNAQRPLPGGPPARLPGRRPANRTSRSLP